MSDIERLTTGIERLDEVLLGGIPRYSSVFIAGLPGTGKTIFSQQALFANARAGRTGLYLSTISEPLIKVLRFLQGFTFFDPDLFGTRVIYGDLRDTLRKDGPPGLVQQVDRLVRQHRPELVVIDSFKAVSDITPDPLTFRDFAWDLSVRLTAWEVTSLLVGEYGTDDIPARAEFAIADGIIYLDGTEEAKRQNRFLRIMKMRGTSLFGGEHLFDIDDRGIAVSPRMLPLVVGEYQFTGERVGSAVEGMNEIMGGGPFQSTSTLINGVSGSGKTLCALGFLVDGARRGRPGLLVSFEESPEQISRNCQEFGWDLPDLMRRGLLEIFHVSPSELNVDRHAFTIKERVDRLGAKLVVIDSITTFEAAVPSPAKYQSYLWAIVDYLKRQGVTIVMTMDTKGLLEPVELGTKGISFIADNLLLLRYVEADGETRRAIGILKMRGSQHDKHLRELILEPPRIAIGPPLKVGLIGLTTGGRLVEEA